MSDIRLQEIVTRAVVGRDDRRVVWSHSTPAEGADNVLGVHVSQVSVRVETGKGEARLQVSATCDLWCSCGDQTWVHHLTCTHSESASVPLDARVVGDTETKASLARGIRCTQAEVEDGQLTLMLETDVTIEVTGTARFWVKAYDLSVGLRSALDSGDSVSDSTSSSHSDSSSSSDSDTSDDDAYLASDESDDLDEFATLRTSQAVPHEPVPVHAEPKPVRESLPRRRTSVISHFQQQSMAPSRVSIIQGH